jgi:hypothetical protein
MHMCSWCHQLAARYAGHQWRRASWYVPWLWGPKSFENYVFSKDLWLGFAIWLILKSLGKMVTVWLPQPVLTLSILVGLCISLDKWLMQVAGTARDTLNYSKNKIDPAEVSPNIAAANLSKRWRSERNFWISFITFTLWW